MKAGALVDSLCMGYQNRCVLVLRCFVLGGRATHLMFHNSCNSTRPG